MQNLGSTAADLGKPEQARRWYSKALELAEQLNDLPQRRIQRQALALALMRVGDLGQAAELFERASQEAAELGDQLNAAVALADAGACLLQAGDAAGARARTERAMSMPGTDDAWRAGQLLNLANELSALGQPEAALQRTLEAANLASSPQETAAALRRAGELAIDVPSLAARAPSIFDDELDVRRKHEPSERWAWRAAEIGATLSHTSQAARAHDFFSIGLRVFARRRDKRQVFLIRNDRALASADSDDLTAAARDLRVCLSTAEALKDRALRQQAHMNLGEIERRRGRDRVAATHLGVALSLACELEDAHARCQTESILALHAQDVGDEEAAERHLVVVEQISAELHDQRLQAAGLTGRAHLAFMRRRYGRASRLYARAARLLADDRSQQLAESLTGQITAAAWRGRLEMTALEQVVALSEHLGWDARLVDELTLAVGALARAGAGEDVAQLATVSLAVAVRLCAAYEHADAEAETGGDTDWDRLSRVAIEAALWIRCDSSAEAGVRRVWLRTALDEIMGSEATNGMARLVDHAVTALEEAGPKD